MATDPNAVRSQLAIILAQLGILQTLAADNAILATCKKELSGWSVGEHVEHLLVTNRGIVSLIKQLLDSSLDSGKKPNLSGRIVLKLGRLPRGRGKAPKVTQPQGSSPDEIRLLQAKVRGRFDRLRAQAPAVAACRATASHPFFGAFTPAMWLRFIDVHDRHHMAIIDEIRAT